MRTDGLTNVTKSIFALRRFAKASDKHIYLTYTNPPVSCNIYSSGAKECNDTFSMSIKKYKFSTQLSPHN
jgi:hypothetical protein